MSPRAHRLRRPAPTPSCSCDNDAGRYCAAGRAAAVTPLQLELTTRCSPAPPCRCGTQPPAARKAAAASGHLPEQRRRAAAAPTSRRQRDGTAAAAARPSCHCRCALRRSPAAHWRAAGQPVLSRKAADIFGVVARRDAPGGTAAARSAAQHAPAAQRAGGVRACVRHQQLCRTHLGSGNGQAR